MRFDWNNMNESNWHEFEQFDEERYMPWWKKVMLCLFGALLPIVGSIETINF